MELEVLKAAMEAAKAKALAAPTDKELAAEAAKALKAYEDALAAANAAGTGDPGEGGDGDEVDESALDEKTKKYLAKLRKENANHRTKNKDLKSRFDMSEAQRKAILKAAGIGDDELKPEEKLKVFENNNQALAFRNAVLESAVQHKIPGDQVEYYEFLLKKAVDELQEGEELPDEALEAIVMKVKASSGSTSANTSVGGGGDNGGGSPKPGPTGGITLEKFCGMTMTEKSKLYVENQALYLDLMAQAKAKKKLV